MTPDERTIALIAALKEAGVEQAAFFVTTGNLEDDYGANGEARIRAYVEAGHVIANHSHSHTHLSDSTVADYIADLDKAEAWLDGPAGRAAVVPLPLSRRRPRPRAPRRACALRSRSAA